MELEKWDLPKEVMLTPMGGRREEGRGDWMGGGIGGSRESQDCWTGRGREGCEAWFSETYHRHGIKHHISMSILDRLSKDKLYTQSVHP